MSNPADVMSPLAGVSIIIPAYNEAQGTGSVLRDLFEALETKLDRTIDYEIIVVDDGSEDGTAEVAAAFDHAKLRIVRHPHNCGYGAAIKTGVAHAAHPWILITDADGTYPSDHIPELLAERGVCQMAVGARIGASAKIPWMRRPPKWVLRRLAGYLSREEIPDLNSGLRIIRKDIVERFENILPNQFSFTSTITLAMLSSGYQVKYLPINYLHRAGKSKIRPVADTVGFLKLILRTVMYFDPLRIFLPTGVMFMVAAIVLAVGSKWLTGDVMDVSSLLLFITGVHMLALGMLADALNRRLQ